MPWSVPNEGLYFPSSLFRNGLIGSIPLSLAGFDDPVRDPR